MLCRAARAVLPLTASMSRMTTGSLLVIVVAASLVGGEPAAAPFLTDADWNRGAGVGAPAASATSGGAMLQMLLGLAVVLGLAWGGAKLVKRIGVRSIMPGRGRHLDVVETVPLGFKRALSVVRLGEHVLVVGQSEQGICHLATLPASALAAATPAAAAPMPAPAAAPAPAGDGRFRAVLANLLGQRAAAAPPRADEPPGRAP